MSHLTVVAGARPNFMKVAPVLQGLDGRVATTLVHTGQHYDACMSDVFFRELGMPEPHVNLGVGSGSHAGQTAAIMVAFDAHLDEATTDGVVVVGDVNSTLACSLVAAKRGVAVAHIEAGLRSFDWSMPEEINRLVTDRLSHWLFTPSTDADENLRREGVDPTRIHLVGNVMIDTLLSHVDRAKATLPEVRARLGLAERYAVATLHRPANVDDPGRLGALLDALGAIDPNLQVIFPVHPRTASRLVASGYATARNLVCVEPLSYLEFVGLLLESVLVCTDSGGIQEETSVLGVPCLTIRNNTERPVTCTLGTNELVGTDPANLVVAARRALDRTWAPARIPLWDGHAGQRVADILVTAITAA